MRMEFTLEHGDLELARARVRAGGRRRGSTCAGGSPTPAARSASACSSRARTTASSTCSGATGAASSTPTIALVASNHPDLAADVEGFGVPYHHVPVEPGGKPEAEARLLELLRDVDLVVLARYMQILSRRLPRGARRPGDQHPPLVPAGLRRREPYQRAFERGVKIIGATAHYVTEELDAGPIIEQDVARVSHREHAETMVRLGRDIERTVLARAVKWHLEDRVLVHGNRTVVF